MTNASHTQAELNTMKKADLVALVLQLQSQRQLKAPAAKWEKVVTSYEEATHVAKQLVAKAAEQGKKCLPRVQRCEGGFRVWFA